MRRATVAVALMLVQVVALEPLGPNPVCTDGPTTVKEYLAYLKVEEAKMMNHPFVVDENETNKLLASKFNWAPSFAHLAMVFSDLNNVILPYATPKDKYEEELNKHYEEDGSHWKMYFQDLKVLGWDTVQPASITLAEAWHPKNAFVRTYAYSTLQRVFEAGDSAFMKYFVLEAFETTVAVFFKVSVKNANAYTARTGNRLRYFGPKHKQSEDSHSRDEDMFINANVPAPMICRAYQIAERHFAAFNLLMTQKFEGIKSLDEKWPEPPAPKYQLVSESSTACSSGGSENCAAK